MKTFNNNCTFKLSATMIFMMYWFFNQLTIMNRLILNLLIKSRQAKPFIISGIC